jgi:hypothetical protein
LAQSTTGSGIGCSAHTQSEGLAHWVQLKHQQY